MATILFQVFSLLMATQVCTACHTTRPLHSFGIRQRDTKTGAKKGEPTAVCLACAARAHDRRQERASLKKRAIAEEEEPAGDGVNHWQNLDIMSLTDFINTVKEADAPVNISARVDVKCALGSISESSSHRERADRVAEVIGVFTELHWT